MNWTKEQLEAIEIKDKNILVSAAAGSGKTAVLVERIKQLILKDKVLLDEMLVVTFTNAAASEMREKIVSAIPDQLNLIHKSHISTFHAFALDVIRRYFHLINIEPGFRICDDTQRIILQREAMEELFRNKFREEDPEFLHFLNLYASSKNEDAVKDIILSLYEFMQSIPEPFEWLDNKKEALRIGPEEFRKSRIIKEIMSEITEELSSAAAICEKVKSLVSEAELPSLIPKASADLEMINRIISGFRTDYDEGSEAVRESRFAVFSTSKEDKERYQDIKDDVQMLRDTAKDCLNRLKNLYCAKTLNEYIEDINSLYKEAAVLCDLINEYDNLYRKLKDKKGVIDFSDIEHYALKILSFDEAASEYRNKFRYIFIDEYQDSNLVQECIISKIQRENNVFMVGDVKQSIYKFRLAEPEIFINKYEDFKKNDSPFNIKLDLNRNFRSKGHIIDFVNDVFSNIMTLKTAGMNYDNNAALYKGIDYVGELDHPVELHLADDSILDSSDIDEEIKEMKKAEMEAFTAARLIKEARGLPFFDSKTGQKRFLSYKDMVILLRSTSGIAEYYSEALEKEGIPSFMDMGDGFFDTLEVSVMLNLLKVIDNKKQDVPLLSVLRSPVFEFSVSELAEIRLAEKKGAYYDAFNRYPESGENSELREKCKLALTKINKWKRRANFMQLPDFLWELILNTGYYNYTGALPGGTQRQANLRALVDKADLYENSQGKGLFGFINYIEAVKKEKVATAPVKLLGESDDVVRIMTVHKSKGLEFPMVLAGNLGRVFHRESGGQISFHKDLGFVLKQVDKANSCWRRTILQNVIDAVKSRDALAEEIRILYVLLTRPMDKLILLGTVTDSEKVIKAASMKKELGIVKGKSYLDFMLPVLTGLPNLSCKVHCREDIGLVKKEQKDKRSSIQTQMQSGFSAEEKLQNEIESRFGWEYRHPSALKTKSKYSVTELSIRKEHEPVLFRKIRSVSGAAERGIVYHKIMELIPFNSEFCNLSKVQSFINELTEKEILTEEEINGIDLVKITQFFTSDIGRRASSAGELFREVSFNLLKEKDGEEIIVQGTIDCYFKEHGRYVLLDYKSGFIAGEGGGIEALADRYRPQLEMYREALETIRGIEVKEMYLYLFALSKEIQIT